jgi:hypothetical protein
MEEGRELCNWYLLDIAVTVIKSGKWDGRKKSVNYTQHLVHTIFKQHSRRDRYTWMINIKMVLREVVINVFWFRRIIMLKWIMFIIFQIRN